MRAQALLLALVTTAGCGSQPRSEMAPIPAPAPAAPAPDDKAVSRADALLEDLKRRETEQYEFNRKHPPQESIPTFDRAPETAASPPAATAPAAAAPETTDPVVITERQAAKEVHDWEWWNKRSQSLRRALEEAQAQLAEAERQNLKNGYGDAQRIYRQRLEAVGLAHAAIDNMYEDARKAGVPPGWLR